LTIKLANICANVRYRLHEIAKRSKDKLIAYRVQDNRDEERIQSYKLLNRLTLPNDMSGT